MAAVAALSLPAPAKLNLRLHVKGRRDDGMHLLDGVMTLIDFCDTVHLTRRDDGEIVRDWQHAHVADADDLAVQAARRLQEAAGEGGVNTSGVTIRIDKKIPIGGGLGGASSNAASVLLGLNRLWQLDWTTDKLTAIAAALGADVPFFLHGKPARVSGIGGDFQPENTVNNSYLLVFPPVMAMTAAVFAEYDRLTTAANIDRIPPPLEKSDNDLTAAAVNLYPQIAPAARALFEAAGEARLSGSGATVFAAFADDAAAKQAQRRLPPATASAVAAALFSHPVL